MFLDGGLEGTKWMLGICLRLEASIKLDFVYNIGSQLEGQDLEIHCQSRKETFILFDTQKWLFPLLLKRETNICLTGFILSNDISIFTLVKAHSHMFSQTHSTINFWKLIFET